MKTMERERVDVDTPWKQAIESLFKQFLEYCYPDVAADIDWSHPVKSLDKELLKVHPSEKVGKHIPDKLFEARFLNGDMMSLFVHVEIQSQKEKTFAKRMFWYNTEIKKRFDRPVVSIAVLADETNSWKPDEYCDNWYNCYTEIGFLVVKLLDYRCEIEGLASSENPFSALILTHLMKLETKSNPENRLAKKVELTKLCEKKGWSLEELKSVLRFIQWVLVLPPEYELKCKNLIKTEDKAMQLHFLEEEGIAKGMQQGMEKGEHHGQAKMLGHLLERRFNQPLSEDIKAKLKTATLEELERWADRVLTEKTMGEVFA